MTDPPRWRLIVDGPAAGAWNMAVDEAILNRYAAPGAPLTPTLRLYGFNPAAVSLGRFQNAAGSHRPEFLRAQGMNLVRRPTGGRAVLHDRERTYAVVGRLRHEPFPEGVVATYRRIAEALADALCRLGAAARIAAAEPRGHVAGVDAGVACFARLSSHEIGVGERKLVGSAQLRRHGAFLQHGSIPLRWDARSLRGALGDPAGTAGLSTDLETAAGGSVAVSRLDEAIVAAFAERFGVRLARGRLTSGESREATLLYSWKYCSTAWTLDGGLGDRETARVDLASS